MFERGLVRSSTGVREAWFVRVERDALQHFSVATMDAGRRMSMKTPE